METHQVNNIHKYYTESESMLKLYRKLDSNLKYFNKCYYAIANKIEPLNKMNFYDKISVKKNKNSFYFEVDTCGYSQSIVKWYYNQSRNIFFDKFFIIIKYYYKKCLQIQKINRVYPKVFSSVSKMYVNLGENLIVLLNILAITYNQDFIILEQIGEHKEKIAKMKQVLNS